MIIHDISVPIENNMVSWPGDPGVTLERRLDLNKGDPATVMNLTMGSHTGTHVDAFCHFKQDGKGLDEMDLSKFIGKALVVEIEDPKAITQASLRNHPAFQENAFPIERVLFKTKNSAHRWAEKPFNEEFIYLAPDAAKFLVEQKVEVVGIDYLSVESYHAQNAPTHHCLLDHGVYIIEGLYLQDIAPGWYELICLPLKIKNGDGAPARVVLRDLPNSKQT